MSLHEQGGIVWMIPIDIIAIINICLIAYLLFSLLSKKDLSLKSLEAMKHLGGLALAFGAFATLAGLFQAFGAIEKWEGELPFQVLAGGLKVALITVLYGLIIHMISMIAYISFKLAKN